MRLKHPKPPPLLGTRKVLFVCMGNICRSPLAEGVFLWHAHRRGLSGAFTVDSCGTGGWHAGEPADPRAAETALRHGVQLGSVARKLEARRDFERFELIVPMDRENLRDLLDAGAPKGRTRLLRSFDPTTGGSGLLDVPDPYYGGPDGFDVVYRMIDTACQGLLDAVAGPPGEKER